MQHAYELWSTQYIELFSSAENASADDRALIAAWSETVNGPVLDAGCGPGHWSALLQSHGIQVEGVDASAAFVQHAARTYPDVPFQIGDLRTLDLAPEWLGGVLAWFSLIHLDPSEVAPVVRRFSAALHPGGTLLVGFFSGTDLEPFDHRVATAWAWPLTRMERLLEDAELEILARGERPQTSGRIFAELTARRPTRVVHA